MTHPAPQRAKGEKGNALVEFAVVVPLVLLLLVGVVDMARSMFHAISIAEGANAGTSYGTLTNVHTSDTAAMQQVSSDSASPDAGTVTATPERYCDCPGAPADGPDHPNAVDCITGSCPYYGSPRVYIRTTVEGALNSLLPYPGVPEDFAIRRSVYRRAQ